MKKKLLISGILIMCAIVIIINVYAFHSMSLEWQYINMIQLLNEQQQ